MRTVVFRKSTVLEGMGALDGEWAQKMAAGAWDGNSKGNRRNAPQSLFSGRCESASKE